MTNFGRGLDSGLAGGRMGYGGGRAGKSADPRAGVARMPASPPTPTPAAPMGNAYGQQFQQQNGAPPGQMRDLFAAFRQGGMPQQPMSQMPQQMPYMGMLSGQRQMQQGQMNPYDRMGQGMSMMPRMPYRFPMGFGG